MSIGPYVLLLLCQKKTKTKIKREDFLVFPFLLYTHAYTLSLLFLMRNPTKLSRIKVSNMTIRYCYFLLRS